MKMSETIFYDYGESGRVATQCEVKEYPTHSKLLDSNGQPLAYKKNPIGFKLGKQNET